MKKVIKKLLVSSAVLISVLPFSFAFGQAQTPPPNQKVDYSVLAPLPNTTIGTCSTTVNDPGCKTTLERYVPRVYTLAVGIAVALAFIMITFGGITYATSDALTGKEQGRKYITDALVGLLLVIGSYVIISTINPNMLSFNLTISDVSGGNQTQTPITAGGCANCVSLGNLPKKAGVSDQIDPLVLPFLQRLDQNMQNANGSANTWRITEAYSDSGVHVYTSCHRTGSCVDANPIDPSTSGLLEFANAARQAGFRNVVYEVESDTAKDLLINGCSKCNPPVTGVGNAFTISVNPPPQGGRPGATARHFHIRP